MALRLIIFFILVSFFVATKTNAQLSSPDIGYWDFNETSGTVATDKSGNNNNGNLVNGPQWTTGKLGNALSFDGVNDYLRITKNSVFNITTDFSIDMWVNPTNWGKNDDLLTNGLFRVYHRGEWAGDRIYFMLRIGSNDHPGDSAWDGWAAVKTSQELRKGVWYHLACVKSGNKMTIYLNGMKDAEADVLAGYSINNSSLTDLLIGGNGSYFNGIIDEVRIWSNALSQEEVQSLYQYPPTILQIGDMTVNAGSSLRFTVIATGVNSGSYIYSASNLPSGATFTPLPAQEIFPPYSSGEKFSWTASPDQVGTYNVCFNVSNGSLAVEECIKITVKNNCLLGSSCPNLSCRGDGVCVENVKRDYGADANPTGNPLGGGVGYSNVVGSGQANFNVSNRNELISALASARSGQIIYIADNAKIDMTGYQNITIYGGVVLASGRGVNNSLGGLIYSDTIETFPLFVASGPGVRVTGLRLQGPDPERRTSQMSWLSQQGNYYAIPNSRGIQSSYAHLEVDNCELSGWSHAAVILISGAIDSYIHHNFIHHNQREGLGYGVVLDAGAAAVIEANVFDWNRHSIAGSRGYPNNYEARYNLVLENANSSSFDMHGGNDISNPNVCAGGNIKIHHNTFMAINQAAVGIRGVPIEGVWVNNNWAMHDSNIFTSDNVFAQWLNNLPGHTPYEKMFVSDNWYGVSPPPLASDTTAPSQITDLSKSNITWNSVTLNWTSPGDDATTGTATQYDIRYSTASITSSTWASITQVVNEPVPLVRGTAQSYTVTGLSANTTYYFAIKTIDEVNNISSLSNVASGKTLTAITQDSTPPTRTNGAPIGSLTAGTTQTTISLSTNESATCRYSTAAGTAYSSMTCTFTTTGGSSHSRAVTGLTNGSSYTYYVRCIDGSDNANTSDFTIAFAVSSPSCNSCGLGTPLLSPSGPVSGASFTMTCPTNASGYDCIDAYANGSSNQCTFSSYSGNNAVFNCTGLAAGTYTSKCVAKTGTSRNCCASNQTGSYTIPSETGNTDITAPSQISDLSVSDSTQNSVSLSWTSPGDDGLTGTANHYDIRYSTASINSDNWPSATQALGEPTPQESNTTQSFIVTGLLPSTSYYFGIKSTDELNNVSPLSNIISGSTADSSTTTAQTSTSTANIAELEALIKQLLAQVAALQAQLGAQQGIPAQFTFHSPLYLGLRNNDVGYLQIFLTSQGTAIYPEAKVTGYYGLLTRQAVIRFQIKQGIIYSQYSAGAGLVGLKTRAKINAMLGR